MPPAPPPQSHRINLTRLTDRVFKKARTRRYKRSLPEAKLLFWCRPVRRTNLSNLVVQSLNVSELRYMGAVSVLLDKVGLCVQRNPLVWALPLQALLLLWNLALLDPWGDEWGTVTTILRPLNEVVSVDPMHPPLYYLLLHYW